MSLELRFSTAESEKKLGAVMWSAAGLCVVWAIVLFFAFSSARGDLTAANAALQSKQTAFSMQEISLRAVSREVHGSPASAAQEQPFPGTASFADDISRMAGAVGAQLTSIEFGAADTDSKSQGSIDSPPTGAGFQCTLIGSFGALLHTLNSISNSSLNIQITQVQIERQQVNIATGDSPVEMRITAQVNN